MAKKEVPDEVIIETRSFLDGLTFLIYGKLKFFDKNGNIGLSSVNKIEKFDMLKCSKPQSVKLLDIYSQAQEIQIQRQIVAKLLVMSKKEIEVENHEER